jgi:hypothetical protein
MGVVTGIVQEFQFGMNWSDYSRFVGDIFGAPLAIEGLLAFFLESTFLGLWIFGWDRLSKKLHLATIWLAATGTLLSAYFILAANSFMQNPVGYTVQPGHRPRRAHRLRSPCSPTRCAGHVPAHHRRRVHHRRRPGAGHRTLEPAPPLVERDADIPYGSPRPAPPSSPWWPRVCWSSPATAGEGDDRGAADEDGRRRSALRD